jgi:hypothetical protein
MDNIYNLLIFLHVMGFVFMSVPLFNLIVVNERALLGSQEFYYYYSVLWNSKPFG